MARVREMTLLERQIFDTPGYSTGIQLEADELAVFRGEVERQWLDRLQETAPFAVDNFREVGIDGYHRRATLVDHRALWPKQYRVLPPDSVARVKELGFLQRLRDQLGAFRIAGIVWDDRLQPGTEEIYWRLVRPGVDDDIGPLHADKWFHELVSDGAGLFGANEVTVKLWIALYTESGLNGLLVAPDTHRQAVRHTIVVRDGTPKPQICTDADPFETLLLPAQPGTIVAFNERLVHGGAVNRGQSTRVSAEITLVLPTS